MMEKFLALLERFVVAHELLAKNSPRTTLIEKVGDIVVATEGPKVEEEAEEPAKPTTKPRTTKPKAAPAIEPEPEEEEEPAPKAKAEAKAPDIDTLRDEIKTMATHIAEGDSDECADEFDDLLEDFKVRTVTKLRDDDVEEFHTLAKELVGKYYEIED
jgi:hypothetical protein